MLHTTIEEYALFDDLPSVSLIAYHGDSSIAPKGKKRPAVLIFPGGAYWVCKPEEQEPVASRWLAAGYHVFILKYSVTKDGRGHIRFPQQLIEAATALQYIKTHAEAWGVDENALFLMGFSAGAHLCASLGTMAGSETVTSALGVGKDDLRVRGMVLGYPVITGGEYIHWGTFNNLLWEKAQDREMLDFLSMENRVTPETPPAFLWASATDAEVSPQNALLMASALSKNGVGFELHVYPTGRHGTTVNDAPATVAERRIAHWFDEALAWMEERIDEER